MKNLSKNFDVVGSPPPTEGVNPFENPGIQPRKSPAGTPGTGTNKTDPHTTTGSIPKMNKGNVFK